MIYQFTNVRSKNISLSKDTDFPEIITRLGAPPKLIHLKLRNCDNRTLWNILKPNIKKVIDTLIKTEISIVEINKK